MSPWVNKRLPSLYGNTNRKKKKTLFRDSRVSTLKDFYFLCENSRVKQKQNTPLILFGKKKNVHFRLPTGSKKKRKIRRILTQLTNYCCVHIYLCVDTVLFKIEVCSEYPVKRKDQKLIHNSENPELCKLKAVLRVVFFIWYSL